MSSGDLAYWRDISSTNLYSIFYRTSRRTVRGQQVEGVLQQTFCVVVSGGLQKLHPRTRSVGSVQTARLGLA